MSNITGLVTKVSIKADAQGNVPTTIELLRVGEWHTLWHGDFEITIADLHEYAANFAKGVGLVEGSGKAPVNYAHEEWDKAAGWMTGLSVDESRNALVASVEWTPEGERAIKEKEWAFISPEFNPRDSYPYFDPEAPEDEHGVPRFIQNVLTGAALTNIPLFKKLKPIMASRLSSKKKADVTSGDGNKPNREGEKMNLEDIRKKQVADLTEEEKTFLSEHKADLTDDERTAFGLEDDPAPTPDPEPTPEPTPEPSKVEASAVKGVQMSQEEADKLRADAAAGREAMDKLERKEADDIIGRAIKAGQIKSGDREKWVGQLLASRGSDRTNLEALIESLPKNENLGKELGGKGQEVSIEASVELDKQVRRIMADARDKGTTVAYSAARKQVLDENPTLKTQLEEEEK
ncbi:phage protease [Rhodococcus sp. NPDC004095]